MAQREEGAGAEVAGTTISFRWAVSFVILAVIACPPGAGALRGVNAPKSGIASEKLGKVSAPPPEKRLLQLRKKIHHVRNLKT